MFNFFDIYVKFIFFKKATKIDVYYICSVKSTVKILSIFVAFLKNMNFTCISIKLNI